MKTLSKLTLFLAAFAISTLSMASGREQLTSFTKGLKGLDGHFEQRVYDPNGRQTEIASGSVRLSAPRQFRWEYQPPSAQLIVADGDRIWIYDPDLEQVTVRNQNSAEQASPLAVLIDPVELDRQFKVVEAGNANGLEWLELTPKKPDDAPFLKARLGFGPQGLARMELNDALGQRTVLAFSAWSRNPAFAKDLFRFVPPPGVDVVGESDDNH
jgi:outer membrane lipoprotein carrier protein